MRVGDFRSIRDSSKELPEGHYSNNADKVASADQQANIEKTKKYNPILGVVALVQTVDSEMTEVHRDYMEKMGKLQTQQEQNIDDLRDQVQNDPDSYRELDTEDQVMVHNMLSGHRY